MRPYFKNVTAKFLIKRRVNLFSKHLNRNVTVEYIYPTQWKTHKQKHVLFLNDGQDAEALNLYPTLEKCYLQNLEKPLMVIAVWSNEDRLQEYGTSGKPDYLKRGTKAHLFEWFILNELIPFTEKEFGFALKKEFAAYAGFSLGGLSALNIVWNNDDVFGKAGVFSGSFWWRSKPLGKGYKDTDRIMHSIVRKSKRKRELKLWLQTGTTDEDNDRNNNGIIDSIDDTLDLIDELAESGLSRKKDIEYVEIKGGKHHPATWAKVFPQFLEWLLKG